MPTSKLLTKNDKGAAIAALFLHAKDGEEAPLRGANPECGVSRSIHTKWVCDLMAFPDREVLYQHPQ